MQTPEDSVVVSTRVDPDVRERLERVAREEDRSMAGTVRHAVRLYLDQAPAASLASQRGLGAG